MSARGKLVTDGAGVNRIELDKLQLKIRVGDGNIRLKAPPSHALTGKNIFFYISSSSAKKLSVSLPN